MRRVLVTGAGGFIGHHLTSYLVARGYWVRGVDLRGPEFEPTQAHSFWTLDLRRWENCLEATEGMEQVYQLAANIGGIGFVEGNKAAILRDNTLIDTHMLEAARVNRVTRYLYASSAGIYPGYRQQASDVAPLREEDAYPADPEDGPGWANVVAERLCRHYAEEFGLETRMARLHGVFGPLAPYAGGRERSVAAICRKVAMANEDAPIELWGDGRQTRSYCYIDDCVEGLYRLMHAECREPLNLGHDRMIALDDLLDLVVAIAGKRVARRYDLSMPQGVRGRSSDNTRVRAMLRWEPRVSLEEGLRRTYAWIAGRLADDSAAESLPVAALAAAL